MNFVSIDKYLRPIIVLGEWNYESLWGWLFADTHPEVGIRCHAIVIESLDENRCLVYGIHGTLCGLDNLTRRVLLMKGDTL